MSAPRAKHWSEAEDRELVELKRQMKPTAVIAKILGRSEEGVRQRLNGIALRKRIKLMRRKYPECTSAPPPAPTSHAVPKNASTKLK